MSNQISNTFKQALLRGDIIGSSDTFKIILVNSSFVFSQTSHHCYADVLSNELANGSGYTTGGITLGGLVSSVDNVNNLGKLTWSDVQWNATGTLVSSGAIIYDDSTSTGSGHLYTDAIVTYIDFGVSYTIPSGAPLFVTNINVTIS
jgi:hypothetical protein